MPAIEPPILRDGDLTLRPPLPGDAEAVTAACQDPAIQRWTFVPSPYRLEHAEQWLAAAPESARASEIGYWLAPGARGRGVATRAVALLGDWGRSELGLRHIEVLPHVDNAPSRRVAERCGYEDTGERRKAPRGGDPDRVYAVYAWEA